MAMANDGFDVHDFLHSLRSTKPPWECPKCHKNYKSFIGIEHHMLKFDHSAPVSSINRPPPASYRKSKLKFSKKKNNNRLKRRSPSPVEFLSPTRDTTLTWAEAQQMVELEAEGKIYRLNISDKLDIVSGSDEDSNDSDNGQEKAVSVNGTGNDKSLSVLDGDEKKICENKSNDETDLNTIAKKSSTPILNKKLSKNGVKTPLHPLKLPQPTFSILQDYEKETNNAPPRPSAYYRYIEKPPDELEEEVEYDMDEEDAVWLELINKHRAEEGISPVTDNELELLMDRFEKEAYFEQAKHGNGSNSNQSLIDEDAVCCVCNDGECQNSNVILFCDMCNLAIHQECYGVPYIPEGQWLCRRCLQSPSSPVDCCLCPNRSGAFKQTDDGRWAHVVCALWVPEVGFGNTVFLEPIDGLKNIPQARWKLTCYVCKQRNAGACIQCHRTNCYVAFHVTCAQHAGLYMNMEVVKKSSENGIAVTIKKEAYCDLHTPADASPPKGKLNGQLKSTPDENTNDKMKKARKLLAEKRLEIPQISIPYIPRERMTFIGRLVTIQKRSSFLQRLLSYWTLKRQSRNGVPLLRRLQTHGHSQKKPGPFGLTIPLNLGKLRDNFFEITPNIEKNVRLGLGPLFGLKIGHVLKKVVKYCQERCGKEKPVKVNCAYVAGKEVYSSEAESEQKHLVEQLKYWQRLRHDLERARLLIELIRKREKLKKEAVHLTQIITELRLTPLHMLLRRVLNKLIAIDTARVFLEPVKASDAPDYYNVIERPMDFSTMAAKIENHVYRSLSDFEDDVNLIINNCIRYNGRDTVFYRLATRLRDHGGTVLRAAKREVAKTGFDNDTGMLLPNTPEKKMEETIDEEKRLSLPIKKQLDILLVRLDQAVLHGKKTKKLRVEIGRLKRKIARENNIKSNGTLSDKVDQSELEDSMTSPSSIDDVNCRSTETNREVKCDGLLRLKKIGNKKRLWSERWSSSPTDSTVKKRILERSGSFPISKQKLLQNGVSLSGKNTIANEFSRPITGGSSKCDLTTSESPRSISLPASPSRECVNRRTAVLFRKKARILHRNLADSISGLTDSIYASHPNSSDVESTNNSSDAKTKRANIHNERAKTNGDIDSDNSFTKRGTMDNSDSDDETRKATFQTYRDENRPLSSDSEQFTSDSSDDEVSDEGKFDISSETNPPESTHSSDADSSSSDASCNDRPGLILAGGGTVVQSDSLSKPRHALTSENELETDDLPHIAPLDLVWAKCWGYPPYPALLINPKMPRSGFCHNGVPIPVPPLHVLQAGDDKRKENNNQKIYLVLFFDTKRTWQWLPRSKLELLGVDDKSDQAKLNEGKKPSMRKNIEAAYKRALLHRSKVTGELPDSDEDERKPFSISS